MNQIKGKYLESSMKIGFKNLMFFFISLLWCHFENRRNVEQVLFKSVKRQSHLKSADYILYTVYCIYAFSHNINARQFLIYFVFLFTYNFNVICI